MNQSLRDDFDKWHDYGCLIKERLLYFGSEFFEDNGEESGVDFASSAKLVKNLLYLDQVGKANITLHYNSPGGDWDRGIAIYDCIKGLRSNVIFVGYGCVRSMGTVIMQACKNRYLTPLCRFMIHDGTSGFYGNTEDHIRDGKEAEKICSQMYEVYFERMVEKNPTVTIPQIKKLCKNDTYMSGKRAVEVGLADKVLS